MAIFNSKLLVYQRVLLFDPRTMFRDELFAPDTQGVQPLGRSSGGAPWCEETETYRDQKRQPQTTSELWKNMEKIV